MAAEGMKFTSFYAAPVCSVSRAQLMTGCYGARISVPGVYFPSGKNGLHPAEHTIADRLKERGYATACVGKWHLGDQPEFLPTRQGFDEYFGLPYSNDMWPHHPTAGQSYPPLPLIEGDKVVQEMPDQTQLTTWYTERAVRFIERNKDRPLLVYLPHAMPHVPLHVSGKFQGKSARGLYGDVIMEIDWSVGQILQALKRLDLDRKTLVIYASDNGPWLSYGNHGGSAGRLREGKGTTFEGGMRVPCIMRWPEKIPAGSVCHELAATIDVLPTVAGLLGVALPAGRVIDGKDIWPLMSAQPGARSPHEAFYYYYLEQLQAVRSGKWKLYLALEAKWHSFRGDAKPSPAMLFDLQADPGETTNVAHLHADVVKRLEALAEKAREDLGDVGRPGKNQRPAAWVDEAKPQVMPE